MSTGATISDIDLDRPPAGTECCSCKAAGHFCPASQYVNQTDLGICGPCQRGEDCDVAKRLKTADVETISFDPPPPVIPPGRTIPKEEWPADTSIHEKKHDLAEVPFGMRSEIRAEQNGTQVPSWKREFLIKNFPMCAEFFTKLSSTLIKSVHDAAIRAVDPSWFIVEEATHGSRMLLYEPIFHPEREPAAKIAQEHAAKVDDATYHLMIWHSGKMLPTPEKKPERVATPPPQAIELCECGRPVTHSGRCQARRLKYPGRKPGDNYKQPQRDAAAELLQQGKSIRETAAAVGLSPNKVIEVKKNTPEVPAKANNGGMPQHKPKDELTVESSMDQEVSVERRESVKVSTRTSSSLGSNPMIVALLQYLPPPGEEFTINQRVKWLNAAISLMEMIYTAPDSEDWMLGVSKDSLV